MGMMARMRSLAPWFILLVGGLFVLFMVISDSKVMDIIGAGRTQNVGSVDGVDISYQEYSNLVERARKSQEEANKITIDESQMDYFRDQVWESLVTQKLLEKKIKQFGITVSDEEVREAILGPNPPQFLKQQFIDSTGNFNRELYERTVMDPQNKSIMIGVEEQIREQLISEKLQHFLNASITVSDEEVKDQFIAQNIKMKANYVFVDPYTIPGEFKPTDAQLNDYYEKHKEDYQVQPSRKIKYVLFRREATAADSASIKNNLAAVVKKITDGDTTSFKSYVEIYSERPYSVDTLSISQLSGQARELLPEAQVGSIVGPMLTSEGYTVYKLDNKVNSKDEYVRASHILVRSTGNDAADEKKANEIYAELMNGADFAALAKEKSDDGTKLNGGDLGWFGKGQMVPAFESACYGGKVGVIQKPIKTSFGWHIIKVTGKSNSKFVVEKIVNKIQPSGSTIDKLYQDAQDFSYIAKENGFESEAKVMRYSPVETPAFTEDNQFVPGLGMSLPIVRWSFENGLGDISDVFKVSSGYVVVMVSDVINAGFKPFEDVKDAVNSAVVREIKFDKAVSIAGDIKSKLGESGSGSVAPAVYAQAKFDSTAEFTTNGNIPSLGREFAFAETAYKADLQKWSKPVKGSRGVYLIKVTYRTNFEPTTFGVQKSVLRNQILQQKRNTYLSQWIQEIKKEADIVDNRYLYYR